MCHFINGSHISLVPKRMITFCDRVPNKVAKINFSFCISITHSTQPAPCIGPVAEQNKETIQRMIAEGFSSKEFYQFYIANICSYFHYVVCTHQA